MLTELELKEYMRSYGVNVQIVHQKKSGKKEVNVLGKGQTRDHMIDNGFSKGELKKYERQGWLKELRRDQKGLVYYIPSRSLESGK